jgi:hypothetical protein
VPTFIYSVIRLDKNEAQKIRFKPHKHLDKSVVSEVIVILEREITFKQSSTMVVPNRMILSAKMEEAARSISKTLLTSLNIENSTVSPSTTSQSLSEILPNNTGTHGSVCFVVRRPG